MREESTSDHKGSAIVLTFKRTGFFPSIVVVNFLQHSPWGRMRVAMQVFFRSQTVCFELSEKRACIEWVLLLELSGRMESIFLGLLWGIAWALPLRGLLEVLMAYNLRACLLVLPLRVFFSACSVFLLFITFRILYNRTIKLCLPITRIHNAVIFYYYFNRYMSSSKRTPPPAPPRSNLAKELIDLNK